MAAKNSFKSQLQHMSLLCEFANGAITPLQALLLAELQCSTFLVSTRSRSNLLVQRRQNQKRQNCYNPLSKFDPRLD